MSARITYQQVPQPALGALMALEKHLAQSKLDKKLKELVKLRASQLNGCAYCLDMHYKDARAAGVDEQRLYSLPAWRETTFYTERERAALAWTEAVTTLAPDSHGERVNDAVYEQVSNHFDKTELADLTFVIIAINSWNRLNVAARTPAGGYRVGMFG